MKFQIPTSGMSTAAIIGIVLLMIVQLAVALGLPILVTFALLRYLGAC